MRFYGQRAILQPLELHHAFDLYQIVETNPDIWTYLPYQCTSLEDMYQLIQEAIFKQRAGTVLPFVVIDQQTNQIVGTTRLYNISFSHYTSELGFTFYSPTVHRSRVNTECKYMLLRHAFEELRMVRVQMRTDTRNIRSQKAMERIGAIKEGIIRNERMLPDGTIRNVVVYSIVREEWAAVRSRLESFLAEGRYQEIKPVAN